MPNRASGHLVPLLLLLTVHAACGTEETSALTVRLQLAADPDPFAGVTRLRLLLTAPDQPPRSVEAPRTAGSMELAPLPLGRERVVTVEGLDAAGTVHARGRSAPFELTAHEPAVLTLFFARVDTFSLAVARLAQGRYEHSATRLADGRVLVAGGRGADGAPIGSTELIDPQALTVSAGPDLSHPRASHAALLAGDTVVLVGGVDSTGPLDSVEIFDPAGGPSQDLTLARPRLDATAASLPDSTILVIGGRGTDNKPLAVPEIIDAAASTVREGPRGPDQALHVAATLADGRVLVAGGFKDPPGKPVLQVQIYDPAAGGSWILSPHDLPQAMVGARAARLANGQILLVGGDGESGPAMTPLLYDQLSGFSALGALRGARSGHAVAVLDDGAIIAGGATSRLVERVRAGRLEQAGELTRTRDALTLTPLEDGTILAVGGRDGAIAQSELERYVAR